MHLRANMNIIYQKVILILSQYIGYIYMFILVCIVLHQINALYTTIDKLKKADVTQSKHADDDDKKLSTATAQINSLNKKLDIELALIKQEVILLKECKYVSCNP